MRCPTRCHANQFNRNKIILTANHCSVVPQPRGLKVAAVSLGSVLAGGVVATAGPRWPIAAGAALTGLAALITTLDRLRTTIAPSTSFC